jgi:hypothetical protein
MSCVDVQAVVVILRCDAMENMEIYDLLALLKLVGTCRTLDYLGQG